MRLLPYLSYRYRYPSLRRFLHSGLGIEARYARCRAYWEKHLELCRQFQRAALGAAHGRVAVLGAGRLLDIDLPFLASHFSEIVLYDADPSCVPIWKNASALAAARGSKLSWVLGDVTQVMDVWASSITRRHSLDSVASQLVSLPAPATDARSNFDAVLSLNLLSQLGVYWRDQVAEQLEKAKLISEEAESFPEPIIAAFQHSQRKLERSHLDWMASTGASDIVLTSDVRFFFYTQDQAEWDCEDALIIPPSDLTNYQVKGKDAWLWHVAPQGIEDDSFGSIHEVNAFHLWCRDGESVMRGSVHK